MATRGGIREEDGGGKRSEEGPAGGESREDEGGGQYRVQRGGGVDGGAEGRGVGDGGWRGRRRPAGEDRRAVGGLRGEME